MKNYLTNLFSQPKPHSEVTSPKGNLVQTSAEDTMSNIILHKTDGGEYITFQDWWADIQQNLRDKDGHGELHINQTIYFCALVYFGLVEKINGQYLPPKEVLKQLRTQKGGEYELYYRRKGNAESSGCYGLSFATLQAFNTEHKDKMIDMLLLIEQELDLAWAEAEEIASIMTERKFHSRHAELFTGTDSFIDVTPSATQSAVFKVRRQQIIQYYLKCEY